MNVEKIGSFDLMKYAMGSLGRINTECRSILLSLNIEMKYFKSLNASYLPNIELIVNGKIVLNQTLYALALFSEFNHRYDGKSSFKDGFITSKWNEFNKESRSRTIDIYYPLYPSDLNLLCDTDLKIMINNSALPAIKAYTNKADLSINLIS